MSEFKRSTLELAIKNLFGKSHFDICALRDIGKMMGCNPEHSDLFPYLHSLHCVNYRDMPPEVLRNLQASVIECLRPQFNAAAVVFALTAEGRDFAGTEDRYLTN